MALPFDMAANCRRYVRFCRDWPPGQSYREAERKRIIGDAGPYENRHQAVSLPPQAAMPSPGEKVDFSLPLLGAMKKTDVECGR